MPTLPPRNLPFSPPSTTTPTRASPSTPVSPSSTTKDRQSVSSSTNVTPQGKTKRAGTGVLPRQEETTFHRRLRNLLLDHSSGTERWEDVVSSQGAKTVAAIARLSASLDDVLAKRTEVDVNVSSLLQLGKEEMEARRLDEMAVLLKGLQAEKENLSEDMTKMDKSTSKLESLSEAAESLLVEATRAKGSDFAFETEMWVTWSMDRFVGAVQLLTSRYVLQSEHLHCLNKLLLEHGCAPGSPESLSTAKRKEANRDEEDDDEGSEAEDDNDDQGKEKRKNRARIRERVMEEWQKLTFLQDEASGINANWLEDICEVEVGRWLED